MNIDKGLYVKCFLRNSICVEGIVSYWDKEQAIIKSIKTNKYSIICNPDDDIFLIEVLSDDIEAKAEPTSPVVTPAPAPTMPPRYNKADLIIKFQETLNQPPSDVKNKSLAELKKLLNEEERRELIDRVNAHTIRDERPTEYEYPKFFTK